jgi:hypothetical protein
VICTLFIHGHIFTFKHLCLHSITKILRNGPKAHFPFTHRTVNSDCPVHHRTFWWPHLSELQRSNPNGWVTWLAHRTIRCALQQQPSPTTTLVVGAINTPNHHTSRHPSFQPTHSIQELVHSIQDTIRVNQNLSNHNSTQSNSD